jgi:uncharacterized protein with GYD domain
MAKYLLRGNYVGEGIKGLMKEGGSSRRAAIRAAVESVGGKLDSVYYALGETDIFVIVDLPDNATATALALTVNSSGGATVSTTALMTPEDVDAAIKKTPTYRRPGG